MCELKARLEGQGARPYAFPSGGSNSVGAWGYIEAVAELELQSKDLELEFDSVYFACGSGGTAAGLALGLQLSPLKSELVGLCVDDSPSFFYEKIDGIFDIMGLKGLQTAKLLRLEQCTGEGYAMATSDELTFIAEVGRKTGVVLDPVYSGKAARGMVLDLRNRLSKRSSSPRKKRVLFIHTGGLLGLFDKASQLETVTQGGWQPF